MKRALLSLILFTAGHCLSVIYAQQYVGLHKDVIMQRMSDEHKTFKLNTGAVNRTYQYLKFEDKINEITILFFLSDNDECTLVRLMADYSNINDIVSELDEKYNSTGKDQWEDITRGKNYSIALEEGDWFFTVTIREKTD